MSDSAASSELLAAAKDAAARNVDCYALLGLSADDDGPPLTRDTVQRAWRKRSLKYHPDSAGAAFDKDRWEEFGLARDILASDEARAAYDGARSARLQKQRERDLMSARQRRFAEELERAEGGAGAGGAREDGERRAREEAERDRQAARGRALAEERRRKVEEAEERERERERKEDEQREDKIRRLEEKIAEKAKRRAEKRAKREARRSGVAIDEDTEMLSPRPAAPAAEPRPAEQMATPIPAVDIQMSDDAVTFWETQWPKTKARLLAAQATKERRMKETQAAA